VWLRVLESEHAVTPVYCIYNDRNSCSWMNLVSSYSPGGTTADASLLFLPLRIHWSVIRWVRSGQHLQQPPEKNGKLLNNNSAAWLRYPGFVKYQVPALVSLSFNKSLYDWFDLNAGSRIWFTCLADMPTVRSYHLRIKTEYLSRKRVTQALFQIRFRFRPAVIGIKRTSTTNVDWNSFDIHFLIKILKIYIQPKLI